MSRPLTSAEHLARLVPGSVLATRAATRRSFLRATALTGAAVATPALLAGCGGDSGGGGGGGVSFGSNEIGDIVAEQRQAMAAGFTEASGTAVELNEVDHNTFQENINTYLQGNPDDVFSWFAGDRMRFFADQGLIGDVSSIYPIQGIAESFQEAATGNDGNQYFVPQAYYPWAVFYRKSVFAERGYAVPATYDELVALCQRMQADSLIPIAFGDADGWPAMGTFDMLNMRINGFDFHIELMQGEASWDSPEVRSVFDTWRELLPYHQPDALGRTWQEAAQTLQQRTSGMYVLGTFINEQFPDDEDDLDFFTFPEIDPAIGADAIDAPIDGFCMAADPSDEEAALAFLEYLASPEAAAAAGTTGLPIIPANSEADTSKLSALQQKSVELVSQAKSIAQFLDRDTRPDVASTVILPSLQEFIRNPDGVDSLVKDIESQARSIFEQG
ncbi:MAG: ABC transporter, substrate-binding protein (cluster 1, maltose/g3p/polyamine/iron) [uncultured Quadrisphaera sp.]|uniref:ABC transporter, substrate-binding protein (Cluster 1, maltose/g3p/polyamine/iron) n=1 Tax=uncultured Quadrisphaera sp. TaxID=904978 RepID=A0A6J4P2V4_9ACTN|nr:MAG: ABC transporter, substrate-binding protein (cluster 1, maltose/g3p/polyamine/iron) [uncultured Quadrisphaera sp.]